MHRFLRIHGSGLPASTLVSVKYRLLEGIQVGLALEQSSISFDSSPNAETLQLYVMRTYVCNMLVRIGTTGTKLVNYVISDRVIRLESLVQSACAVYICHQ